VPSHPTCPLSPYTTLFRSSAISSSSSLVSRHTPVTASPRAAYSFASSRPMPRLAPVISTFAMLFSCRHGQSVSALQRPPYYPVLVNNLTAEPPEATAVPQYSSGIAEGL